MKAQSLYPLSGVAFIVLAVGTVLLFGDSPDGGASAGEVVDFYDGRVGSQSAASFVFAASVPFLVVFGLHLAGLVEDGGIWRRMLIAGTAAEAALILATAAIHFTLVDAIDQGIAGDAARALNSLDSNTWVAWTRGLGVLLLGAGVSSLRSRAALPRWLGGAALVLGIALFLPFVDFFALVLSLLWILVTSLYLAVGRGHAAPAAATAAAR